MVAVAARLTTFELMHPYNHGDQAVLVLPENMGAHRFTSASKPTGLVLLSTSWPKSELVE